MITKCYRFFDVVNPCLRKSRGLSFLSVSFVVLTSVCSAGPRSGDAYVHQDGQRWTFGTRLVERVVEFSDGHLELRSLRNAQTGRELTPAGVSSEEIFFSVTEEETRRIHGQSEGWSFVKSDTRILKQGELQLDITLARDGLRVTKSYVVHPLSSVIREWSVIENTGKEGIELLNPGFLDLSIGGAGSTPIDFLWMTGGASIWGSWKLHPEDLGDEASREYDSYDPFPVPDDILDHLPGDGVEGRILHNDTQIWPEEGWAYSPHSLKPVLYDFSVDVKKDDRLVFLTKARGPERNATYFDPTITDDRGVKHIAWAHYEIEQGKNGWRYEYVDSNGEFRDLVHVPGSENCISSGVKGVWSKDPKNPRVGPRVGWNYQEASVEHAVARVWVPGHDGGVQVKGRVANGWNFCGNPQRGHKGGSTSYAPWYAYMNRESGEGLFMGFDYFGRWRANIDTRPDGSKHHQIKVMNYRRELQPGETFTTPKAFVGLFVDDIDNAGNECLDWQYRYLWDYTRDKWFPKIRMLGAWLKGCGLNPDIPSAYRKVFRVVDLMRYCGGDVYHRDWGWWDKLGDWNGPDWRSANEYLKKYDMGLLLYGTVNYAERDSRVGKAYGDFALHASYELDLSSPAVVDAVTDELHRWYTEYGAYTWRNDGGFLSPDSPDDTVLRAQDEGFRRVMKTFLDDHPDCAFQAVNGGGTCFGYEYTRFSSAFSFSDGDVGILRNYWASLVLPPDKTSDFPEKARPDDYDKATWRGMLSLNLDPSQDTSDPEKMEGLRELIDIYHYLETVGVVGRWVKVYRPIISGDDPTMYFQRLSGDSLRGVILPKRAATGPVNIRPKGLLPQESYLVSYHEAETHETRNGKELMDNGIAIEKMLPGEILYLNVPLHPGSSFDIEPPTAPRQVVKRRGRNMGYPGVEIEWRAATDNNWISYYEIWRNGERLDKLAKGRFYFDHSLGADLGANYEIATVDGAGNLSALITAEGPEAARTQIWDDAESDDDLQWKGSWEKQNDSAPAHRQTLTRSNSRGDSFSISFEGRRVLWFTKLGMECGKARVVIDGEESVLDTYSADDIWGIAILEKDFSTTGPHTLTITVLDEHGEHPSDPYQESPGTPRATWVYIDGIRVE